MIVDVIGRGRWGKVLAREVAALGHDVVSFGRGERGRSAPAVVLAVPPAVQPALAEEHADQMLWLEKPLALSKFAAKQIAKKVTGRAVVDHLRLLAPSWKTFKRLHTAYSSVSVKIVADVARLWPVPSPLWWDWGPHAIAYVLDLFGDDASVVVQLSNVNASRASVVLLVDGVRVTVDVALGARRSVSVTVGEHVYVPDATEQPLGIALEAFFDVTRSIPRELSLVRGVRVVSVLELAQ